MQCSIIGFADDVMLDSDAGAMVGRIVKLLTGRHGLARVLGNRCQAAKASQSLLVSPSHGVMRFSERRDSDTLS